MIKKDQIEKMAKDYYGYSIDSEADCKFVAEEMYNKGHRKLSEDSVVLSREEYNEIKMYQSYIPEMKKAFDKVRNATIKETTENIFDILYQWLDLENIEKYGFVTIQKFDFLRKFREIYKQFGLEIKE